MLDGDLLLDADGDAAAGEDDAGVADDAADIGADHVAGKCRAVSVCCDAACSILMLHAELLLDADGASEKSDDDSRALDSNDAENLAGIVLEAVVGGKADLLLTGGIHNLVDGAIHHVATEIGCWGADQSWSASDEGP